MKPRKTLREHISDQTESRDKITIVKLNGTGGTKTGWYAYKDRRAKFIERADTHAELIKKLDK